MKQFHNFLIFLIIFFVGFGVGHSYFLKNGNPSIFPTEKNTSKSFVSEVYEMVKENYWDNISDAQLLEMFKLSFDKNGGNSYTAKFESKEKLLQALENHIRGMEEKDRNKFTSSLVGTVLASLNPIGRSGLFTQKNEQELKNTVENIDPQKDLYKNLGLNKGASEGAVLEAFGKKAEELKNDNSDEGKAKLKEVTYAKDVLTKKEEKARYDQKGVEPTIFTKVINSNVLYVQFKKFSPTSYDEFLKAFDDYKNSSVTSLVFDLRGNVGGSIDAAPYFLGNFLGKNQNAFDFYHKGEYLPFKTPTEKLSSISKYKQVVVLVDNNTQSSAEIMASSLKKYHIGVIVGSPTHGWGTVERVFPIENQFDKDQKYSLFLVHSITIRDDNLPIEGRGVEPDINFKDSNWEQQLFAFFNNQQLVNGVKDIYQNGSN